MEISVWARGVVDDLRDSLWIVPGATIPVLLVLSRWLVELEPLPGWLPEGLVYGGTPEGAFIVLAELAGATFTVVALVLSLTVIALQMASAQFTPRLMRTFMKDRGVQVVLSGMIGSAVYDVAVLRFVRSPAEDVEGFVPRLAVTVAFVLGLIAVGLLLYFLNHVTQRLRVDVIMADIVRQTLRQISARDHASGALPDLQAPAPPADAEVIAARRTGYAQLIDTSALATAARRHGAVIRLRPVIGERVQEGTTLAWAWRAPGTQEELDLDELGTAVHRGLHLGSDRTESSDLAFGLRQLQDISVRALSTGVNDPTTAVMAIGQMSTVLVALAELPLGAEFARDADDQLRITVPHPVFASYLHLAVAGSRDHGANQATVVSALLALLTDVAEVVSDDGRRLAVAGHIQRVRDAADLADRIDLERVHRAADAAAETLHRGIRPVTIAEAN